VGDALVKVAVVSEAGQRIRQGKSRGAHGAQQRSLVELDREQRPRERQREPGRLLPDDDQRQHAGAHQGERHDRLRDTRADQASPRAPVRAGDDRRDQEDVHDVATYVATTTRATVWAGVSRPDRRDREPGDRCGQRERGRVVGDANRRSTLDQLHDSRRRADDEHARRPPEENHGRQPEYEGERDAVGVEVVDGNKESVGQERCSEKGGKSGENR